MGMNGEDLWAAALKTLSEEDRNLVAFDGQHKLEVLSDLGQLVATAKESSVSKRWRFHRPGDGQTVILRDLFSKIVVWIDHFKEIGDIVVQYDPVHAALPWAGVRFLLQIAAGDINKFAFVVESAETIARSISRYATFEQIYLGHDASASRAVEGLKKALVKLYAAILIYLSKAKKYFEESTPKRVAKAVVTSQNHFEASLGNIDQEIMNVDRHAGLVDAERSNDISDMLKLLSIDQRGMHAKLWELLRSIDTPICRMSGQLDKFEDHLDHSERVKILEWLSSQPYQDHHRQIKTKALAGSGQWLLQDPLYTQWYNQSVSSLLWLRGKAGSGKSTLVSLVIEDMIQKFKAGQNPRPVYFYCTRSGAEPERSKPNAVFASILRQLSCVQPNAPLLNPVIETYKRQGEGFASNGLDLDDSRDLIVKLVEIYGMTIIIVDALDECDPLLRQSLLDAFEHILKESAGLVKIFVSSRNDQDIVYNLRDYPNLNISSDKNAADIENYVETETQKLVKKGQLLRNSRAKEEMTELIIEELSSGADGMFRWVSLQLDVLQALKRDEDVRTRLGKLPRELEQLYHEVYHNLITDQDEVGQSIMNNALKWLLCAREELRTSVFLRAVAANVGSSDGDISLEDLLDLCNNFIIHDESLDVFRFAHLSVREFLEKKPEFSDVSCNSVAAECCLIQVMASSNSQIPKHLISHQCLLRLRGSSASTELSSRATFLDHANNSWITYCQSVLRSNKSGNTKVWRLLAFFFSDSERSDSALNAWVQWHCGRVLTYRTSEALVKLQEFLNTSPDPLSRSFLVATYCGFSEILRSRIENRELSGERKDQGLLLAAIAAQGEIFDILSENREDWAMTEPLLLYAVQSLDKERLTWLLAKVPDTVITPRVIAALIKSQDDEKMTVLLDKYPDFTVTEGLLDVAAESASLNVFRTLVARAVKPTTTEHILQIPRYWSRFTSEEDISDYEEKIKILLERMEESDLTPHLMTTAAVYSHERVVEAILERGGARIISEEAMIAAAWRGAKVLRLMLHHGGKITNAVLDEAASFSNVHVWQLLLEQSYKSNIDAKRLKLAALRFYYDDAVLSTLLDHADDSILANELARLICEVARESWENEPIRLLLDRAKDVNISQDMLLAATLNSHDYRLERVRMVLERLSEVQITEDMLIVAARDTHEGIELIEMFLERECEVKVSEYILMAAACNDRQGYQIMQLLLEHDGAAVLTENVLLCAAQNTTPDLVLDILERSEIMKVTGRLLEAAAANESRGGEIMRLLLARAEITDFPEDVLVRAVENMQTGEEVILVLEERFGRTNMSESLMVRCVRKATAGPNNLLLKRTDTTQLTKEILISAISNQWNEAVQVAVAEKSLHIPITSDILQMTAEFGIMELFRFLWNRSGGSSVAEDFINAAARNLRNPEMIMEFLLHESNYVEIGQKTLIDIVANKYWGSEVFDLLTEHGLQADTTNGEPETLLMDQGIKVKSSDPSRLQLSSDMKVTEDMFKIAASRGDERLLQKLTEFCELEKAPEELLDIARLRNAACQGNEHLLKTLLERGVAPDIASPDGGPNLKSSPLCQAAKYGHFEIAKTLLDAGASIDFEDDEGNTPAMLAKAYQHILVFKYLDQCRIEQEKRKQETTTST